MDKCKICLNRYVCEGEYEFNCLNGILDNYSPSKTATETVVVLKSRLEELLRSEAKLSYLEAYGVDNWEGYDMAMSDFYKEEEEEL